MRPTALRAEVYAGTERPVGIDHEPVKQRDLLSTVVSNDALLDRQSSVAATYNRVKTFFEIHFSLRGRACMYVANLEVATQLSRTS